MKFVILIFRMTTYVQTYLSYKFILLLMPKYMTLYNPTQSPALNNRYINILVG